jgi:predicted hotdog family 3-hydroxylacyl-ACP dehydratase
MSATSNRHLARDAIAARVPHAGPMCLLDEVVSWDEQHIECTASVQSRDGPAQDDEAARRDAQAAHPLSHDGGLPASAAIEYAAQAMALHGRLLQEQAATAAAPARGFLAGLRSVRLHCRWITPASPLLTVRVTRFAGDAVQVLYDFEVRAAGPIAQGRAVVVLDAAARAAAGASAPQTRPGQSPERNDA